MKCRTPQELETYVQSLNRNWKGAVEVTQIKAKGSEQQNRLQWLWCHEAEQQGDQTATEYQGYCKLHFGIPMLRAEDEEFRDKYDRVVRPLPYEKTLELMMPPFDFPVTRLMSKDQKARYLTFMYQHFLRLGFVLTEPSQDNW